MANNRHLEFIERLLSAETYFRSRQKEVKEHEPERWGPEHSHKTPTKRPDRDRQN